MSDREANALAQGLTQEEPPQKARLAEIAAAILSVIWAIICLIFWFRPDVDWTGPLVMIWLTGFMVPVGLIWLSVATVRTSIEVRAESERLRAAIAELRRSYRGPEPRGGGLTDAVVAKLEALGQAQDELRGEIAGLLEGRATAQPAVPTPQPVEIAEPQASLSLGTPAEMIDDPVTVSEFIGALNFPENEHDTNGFEMLRKALKDRATQRLVRASQDVLTLLSQDGVYMDDLRPDRARPEIWRAFARGDRGRAIAGLGGVHDRSSLALASGRMRQDPVFRDAMHHFLRAFDQTFMEFERHASDEDIINLANTRTARAFMLLGRVAGTFD